jgi:hypothetical protein
VGCDPVKETDRRAAVGAGREFTVRTSIGLLSVAECGLCRALSIQDAGQLHT